MDENSHTMNSTGVAVVGAGYWGKNLVRVFHELGALRAVCDIECSNIDRLRRQYRDVPFEQDIGALIDREDIGALIISTPAETHYELARRALLSGKDVFVEKPLALKPADGAELVELARSNNRLLMVGHILLYHPAIVKLRELIASGELGRIQYIYSNRLNLGKIRREENILWSFAPHDISVILMLLGEMPTKISAHGGCYLHSLIQDVTVSTLAFGSGVRAHLFVSWLHPFKEQKLVVVGERQMAVFDDLESRDKLCLYSHQIEWVERVPIPHKAEAKVIPIDGAEPLKEECKAFLRALATREEPASSGAQGLRVLQVLDACQRSLELGGQITGLERKASQAAYFVHPTSVVDEGVEIGAGTKIWHFSHIMSDARVGQNCNIGQNVVIAPEVVIGNNVKIQNNVSVYTGVRLEDDVFCGPSMVFTNVNNPRSAVSRRDQYASTLVKRGATLGANSTIVCGHTIGQFAFVGAGAVVTKSIPDYAMVAGNPARIIGWACECGIRLILKDQEGYCRECGRHYQLDLDLLTPL